VCNTLVNYQRRPATVHEGRLRARDLDTSRDPWPVRNPPHTCAQPRRVRELTNGARQFDVVLRVLVDDALAHPQLEYNTGVVSCERIAHVAKVFGQRLQVSSRV